MTEQKQIPGNLILVDREWLQEKIKGYNRVIEGNSPSPFISNIKSIRNELLSVLSNSFPLTPIQEAAWVNGSMKAQYLNPPITGESWDAPIPKDKQSYLSQPITLKKK